MAVSSLEPRSFAALGYNRVGFPARAERFGATPFTFTVQEEHVEFLNFVLIFITAWLLLRKPEKERLAFRLLVVSVLLMVVLFSLATRTGLLPGVNY